MILVTLINGFIFKRRSSVIVSKQPELRDGYDRLLKGYLIYFNIPSVIIAIGTLIGGVPSIISYFRPRDGNPFVIAFHIAVVIMWLLSIWWVYFKGGAEFLVKYKGFFNRDFQSPTNVKIFFGLTLLGGLLGMILMWSW